MATRLWSTVLIDLERYGDFGQYGDLVKRQKSHRNAALIRLGVASEPAVRQRDVWGPVDRARPVTPRPPEPPRDGPHRVTPAPQFAHRPLNPWMIRHRTAPDPSRHRGMTGAAVPTRWVLRSAQRVVDFHHCMYNIISVDTLHLFY